MHDTLPTPSLRPTLMEKLMQAGGPLNKLTAVRIARKRWLPLTVLAILVTTITAVVIGQTAAPIAVNLSSDPLFANPTSDKPAMALALSVEFPTVGAQYRDSPYSNTKEYLGYYDAESCYTYNNTPTETRPTGVPVADYKRFDRSGSALSLSPPDAAQPTKTSRKCTDAFSGNFLNWASSSSIDMLRLALSGGDRFIDTAGSSTTPALTILQRAVLPNGNPTCMWNSGSNFPAKQLPRAGGTSGSAYFGAVPLSMQTDAGTNDIWIANTLNQIYFGTASGGGCGNTTSYALGTAIAATGSGPVVNQSIPTLLPADASGACASEGGTCNFTGVREVWYGALTNWAVAPASGSISCSNGVFGDPISGTPKNCYTRPYSGTWTGGGSTGLNSDGYFFARVQVCNLSTSTPRVLLDNRDFGLCTQYPNGYYKPTGSIQKYSEQLRLAAFGYLMDQTNSASGGRYGGVLRAPMKFVGAKTFNEAGIENTPSGGNPNAEWDPATGVFNLNPDGDTTQTPSISGVINYLNKFGRTGPTPGKYKIYDPVGELYGEALRYLQGLGPTPSAVSSITSTMYDGYPAYTSWTDPYGGTRTSTGDYSCLKSNIVLVGDANSHESNTLLTRTADTSNNIQDFAYWKGVVTDFEANTSRSYLDGQGTSRTTGNPNTPNMQSQTVATGSQVITGQAYWAHTHDIRGTSWTAGSGPNLQRPGLRVKSYFFDVNEGSSSNSTSYRQNRNQFFTASKYGGFESDSANIGGKPYNSFGNPFKRQNGTDDNNVWQNPTAAGEASTFYLSSNARATLSAFDAIFSRAATAARSIAGIAAAKKSIDQSGTVSFQAGFDTSDWSGDVTATPLLVSSSNQVSVSPTNLWSAAARLNNLPTPATTRNIVVGIPGGTANPVASSFTWTAIDTALQGHLSKSTPSATTDTLGQDRLNYIRGDNSKEGTTFRVRNKLLGDIVNSGAVFSGTPTTSLSGANGYTAFLTANSGRTPAVFVGANDGMLHAFNATNGDELFGYIPSWMGPKLGALTLDTYINNHQSYVDATPIIAEAQVGSSNTQADWKTVLVSGTGAGGPGVFALDVTNPAAFTPSKVMWEFTRADDPDMGYVVGRPQIVKMRTSAYGAAATYRWFAAVASGVNNYVADSSGAFTGSTINTTGGNPALFLLALDKPAGSAWTATGGTPNYYKISVPVNSALSAINAPGLINFRATFGAAREVTQIFMGDLHGQLWKLDFTLKGATQWSMNQLSFFKTTSSVAYPFYIARTAAGTGGSVQPISMAPTVVAGPIIQGINTSYVAFATGKYLEVSDKTSTAQNTVYAVYDNGSTTADTSPAGVSAISGRGRLKAGVSNASTQLISVPVFSWGRATSDADTTQRSGWYADFATSGERQISDAKVNGNNLVFGSLIPAAAGAVGSCAAGGGSGYAYNVNIDTGNGSFSTSTVGLLGEPLLAEILSAATYTKSDATGRRTKTVIKQVIQQGSLGVGSSATDTLTTTFVTGRLSWRQINNYQDLKNAP